MMWEPTLSHVILEFFTWNPKWDPYLSKQIQDRVAKHKATGPREMLSKPLKIVAHRRSGNHLLWENLHINYNIEEAVMDETDDFKYHRPFKDAPDDFTYKFTCIYIIRDPRDTLVSNWFYWKNGGEIKSKVKLLLENKTFSEYLRGIDPAELDRLRPDKDEMDMYLIKEHIKDPVQHWLDYTAWAPAAAGVVRYEDLVADPDKIIIGFGKQFNLKPSKDRIWTVKKDYDNIGVGYKPRKGIVGDWKNHFSLEDNEYILDKAGDKMKEFGYDVIV
jgi:hypothetical protein